MNLRELNTGIKTAIIFHDELNPKLWDGQEMKPVVRYKLLSIAKDFIDFIDIDDLGLEDITISGSNAAYTYTENSDIDLHLVVNVPESSGKQLPELFDAKKNQYNFIHDITIKGIDVEVYVQDSKQPHHSAGIFSILDNKWLSEPSAVKVKIDDQDVKQKVENYHHKIELALQSDNLELVKRVKKRIGSLRKAGLEKEGEFSVENIAFKVLRAQGFFEKLQEHIYDLEDKKLSMENTTNASR